MKFTDGLMVTVNQRDQIMYDNNNGTTNAQVKNNWREIVESDESTKIFEVKAGRPPENNLIADNRSRIRVFDTRYDQILYVAEIGDMVRAELIEVPHYDSEFLKADDIAEMITEDISDEVKFGMKKVGLDDAFETDYSGHQDLCLDGKFLNMHVKDKIKFGIY